MISLEDYLMGREKKDPIDEEMRISALHLLSRVNELLDQFYKECPSAKKRVVTSGYRPASINAAIGGAKRSNHMNCTAVDLSDADKELSKWITVDILVKYDLYMESPLHTKTWTHLQTTPTHSGKRIFNP